MQSKNILLAIVIPFYKITYFEMLLEALKNQSNTHFNVYVGDDCSPDNPCAIIDHYRDSFNITYKRFHNNLGHFSLTKQWERCIEMVHSEEWIWILPDDDFPSLNVVEEFYKHVQEVKNKNIKVFRLPLQIVDENGVVSYASQINQEELENNYDFYIKVLQGQSASSLGDYIYHKKSLMECGGFVDFPKAWLSDHATVINVSSGGYICNLKSTLLHFRMSSENISSDNADGVIKLKARIMFVEWIKHNENIFPKKPEDKFYKLLYWKGEHYVMYEWPIEWGIFLQLYKLRNICFGQSSLLSIIKLAIKKILATSTGIK